MAPKPPQYKAEGDVNGICAGLLEKQQLARKSIKIFSNRPTALKTLNPLALIHKQFRII